MARRLPACVLAVVTMLPAGCGDKGSGAPQGNGFVEGATQLGGRLPHLEWQPEGGETLVGWSRVFEVTGDPLEVFDALADRLGFGPKVTAARACAVSGDEPRLLRDEPRSGEGPLWCEVESGEGRVNLLFPVGRACA